MKTRVGRGIIVLVLAFALAAGTAPVSAAPFQYTPTPYAPQRGLTITFHHWMEKPAATGHQLTELFVHTPQLEIVSSVLKTGIWTSGMKFDQATVTDLQLDKMSWAGMTDADWVEISGWIWMPSYGMLSAHCGANTRMQVWANDQITVDWQDEPNHFSEVCRAGAFETPVKIRIRVSPITVDGDNSDPYYWPVDCWFELLMPYTVGWTTNFADYLYPRFPVDAFRRPVSVDDGHDFIYIARSDIPNCLDLNDYEFGIVGGTFETLHRGDNYIAPKSGQYAVRAKAEPQYTYVLGALSIKPPADVKIVKRTPTTATLSWTPTQQSSYSPMPPVTFEVYRKTVGWDASFGQALTSISTIPGADYAGSTTGTTFTDKGLTYDAVYEYFVRAVYPEGHGDSAAVRSDSINMEGLLMPPRDLAVASNDGKEVALQWRPVEGAKGYRVFREDIATPYLFQYGTYAVGKTSSTTFKDTKATGMQQQATYKYYAQALDSTGIPSRLSIPVVVVVKDSTPPSAPGSFAIEGGSDVMFLGPTRQVSMSWDPSTDDVGVAGYDVLRSALGYDGTLPGDAGFWQEPVHKVGSTTGTTYTDTGLQPGACYTYYVAAKDAEGNTSQSRAFVIVHCPYLSGLTAKGDGKGIALRQWLPSSQPAGIPPEGIPIVDSGGRGDESVRVEPAAMTAGISGFQYNCGDYAGAVDNLTKTLTLNLQRIDPKATVLIDGQEVPEGKAAGPYPLDVGENRFEIEVISRPTSVFWGEARMTYTVTVTRANLAPLPVLTVPAASAPIHEGSHYQVSGSITAVPTSPWLGTVDYGDGSVSEALILKEDGTFDLLHTYADDGEYEVKVAFRYLDLGLVTATAPVTVTNVPPSIAVGSGTEEYTADEGSVLGLAGIIADPGADTWTLTADFGDSLGLVQVPVSPNGTFCVQHTYYDEKPSYQVIFSATDDDGGTGNLSLTVNVTNVAPVVDVGGRAIAQRDVPFQRAGSFVDPGREEWTGWVDFGDRSGEQALSLSQNRSFLLEHVYTQNGQYAVTARIADSHGSEDVAGFTVVVKDFVFSVDAGGDMQVNEGEALQATARVSGPIDKMVALTVDYGDGSAKERLALVPGAEGQPGAVAFSHTYDDNGQFMVTVTLIDSDGYTYEDSFTADVLNVAPDVKLSAGTAEPVGGRLALSGSFTDPGDQKWTGTVDSGDGSAVKSLKLGADKTFSVNYTYKRPGVYAVKVTVRDDDGGEGFATCRVVVKSRESSDARLYGLSVDGQPLEQVGGIPGAGFDPDCEDYRVLAAVTDPATVIVNPARGATAEYFDFVGGHWDSWPGNDSVPFGIELRIRVTSEDGRVWKLYTVIR